MYNELRVAYGLRPLCTEPDRRRVLSDCPFGIPFEALFQASAWDGVGGEAQFASVAIRIAGTRLDMILLKAVPQKARPFSHRSPRSSSSRSVFG